MLSKELKEIKAAVLIMPTDRVQKIQQLVSKTIDNDWERIERYQHTTRWRRIVENLSDEKAAWAKYGIEQLNSKITLNNADQKLNYFQFL